jgi:hypothetical protein
MGVILFHGVRAAISAVVEARRPVRVLDPQRVPHNDQQVRNVEHAIDRAILEGSTRKRLCGGWRTT